MNEYSLAKVQLYDLTKKFRVLYCPRLAKVLDDVADGLGRE